MKTKELIQSLKIIVLGLVLAFGFSYAYASFTQPGNYDLMIGGGGGDGSQVITLDPGIPIGDEGDPNQGGGGTTPPAYNALGPLNVGGVTSSGVRIMQTKLGDLTVAGNYLQQTGINTPNLVTGILQIHPLAIGGGGQNRLCASANGTLVQCSGGVCAAVSYQGQAGSLSGSETGTSLCSDGTASSLSGGQGSTDFSWTCTKNGIPKGCSAHSYGGCGSASGKYFSDYTTAPGGYAYCGTGTITGYQNVNNNGSWAWASWKCGISPGCCTLTTNKPPYSPSC